MNAEERKALPQSAFVRSRHTGGGSRCNECGAGIDGDYWTDCGAHTEGGHTWICPACYAKHPAEVTWPKFAVWGYPAGIARATSESGYEFAAAGEKLSTGSWASLEAFIADVSSAHIVSEAEARAFAKQHKIDWPEPWGEPAEAADGWLYGTDTMDGWAYRWRPGAELGDCEYSAKCGHWSKPAGPTQHNNCLVGFGTYSTCTKAEARKSLEAHGGTWPGDPEAAPEPDPCATLKQCQQCIWLTSDGRICSHEECPNTPRLGNLDGKCSFFQDKEPQEAPAPAEKPEPPEPAKSAMRFFREAGHPDQMIVTDTDSRGRRCCKDCAETPTDLEASWWAEHHTELTEAQARAMLREWGKEAEVFPPVEEKPSEPEPKPTAYACKDCGKVLEPYSATGHLICPSCKQSWHPSWGKQFEWVQPGPPPGPWQEDETDDGVLLEWRGEWRLPKKGEWIVSEHKDREGQAWQADMDHGSERRFILHPIVAPADEAGDWPADGKWFFNTMNELYYHFADKLSNGQYYRKDGTRASQTATWDGWHDGSGDKRKWPSIMQDIAPADLPWNKATPGEPYASDQCRRCGRRVGTECFSSMAYPCGPEDLRNLNPSNDCRQYMDMDRKPGKQCEGCGHELVTDRAGRHCTGQSPDYLVDCVVCNHDNDCQHYKDQNEPETPGKDSAMGICEDCTERNVDMCGRSNARILNPTATECPYHKTPSRKDRTMQTITLTRFKKSVTCPKCRKTYQASSFGFDFDDGVLRTRCLCKAVGWQMPPADAEPTWARKVAKWLAWAPIKLPWAIIKRTPHALGLYPLSFERMLAAGALAFIGSHPLIRMLIADHAAPLWQAPMAWAGEAYQWASLNLSPFSAHRNPAIYGVFTGVVVAGAATSHWWVPKLLHRS